MDNRCLSEVIYCSYFESRLMGVLQGDNRCIQRTFITIELLVSMLKCDSVIRLVKRTIIDSLWLSI